MSSVFKDTNLKLVKVNWQGETRLESDVVNEASTVCVKRQMSMKGM